MESHVLEAGDTVGPQIPGACETCRPLSTHVHAGDQVVEDMFCRWILGIESEREQQVSQQAGMVVERKLLHRFSTIDF